MAARDIMPFKSPRGGHNEVRWAAMTAGGTFEVGEPVAIVDAGTLTEPPQDDTQFILTDIDTVGNICGIAAFGPGSSNIDPMTGSAFATGAMIAYYPADQGTLFITDNFFAAAAGSAVAPALTDIGEIYQITYAQFGTPDAGWGVEQTAGVPGTDVVAVIYDVLDSNKVSINESSSNGTGVYVVFEMKTK